MDTRGLRVRSGEAIEDAWARLVRWVDALQLRSSADLEVKHSVAGGVFVRSRVKKTWVNPFKVGASSTQVSIVTGTVNNVVPVVRDSRSGNYIRIDNRDEEGILRKNDPYPLLEINLRKADELNRVFICVRVAKDFRAAEEELRSNPENLQIVQSEKPTGPSNDKESGYYPLAIVHTSEDRKSVTNVFQVVHHNLRYSYQERNATPEELITSPSSKKVGRHLFCSV